MGRFWQRPLQSGKALKLVTLIRKSSPGSPYSTESLSNSPFNQDRPECLLLLPTGVQNLAPL